MASASLVFGKCFTFHLWYTDFTSSSVQYMVLHECPEIENGTKKKKKGMRLNSYYITKCNYKAFNHLCCPDRLTLWNRAQIRKWSARCEFFQQKRVKAIHREEERKHRLDGEVPEELLHNSAASHICCG